MEMDSEISVSAYYSRYGHLKFKDFKNPSHKKTKYSPTSVLEIYDSSSNTMIPPLPQNPIFTEKLSPIILHLRRCSKNMKKRKFTPPSLKKSISSSVEVISKGLFQAAVQKPSAAVQKPSAAVTHDGGVRKCSSWVKSRLLGKGAYASVYLATSKNEKVKTERAIKSAELSRASSLMHEGRILRRLQSPFVIRCYGDEIAREGIDHHYNLILEYCSGQCLADMIEDNNGGLSEFDVKLFARDVLSGLSYIHDRNIIHCDIKPDNLFLSRVDHRLRSNGYLTKIGDFGLAMEKGSVEYGNGCGHKRGTTRYMAPELIGCGIVDFSVDTWAFGCSIFEMLTGQLVWGEHGDLVFEDWVNLIGHSDLIPHIPSWLSAEAQDFLKRCLVKEPDSRYMTISRRSLEFIYLHLEMKPRFKFHDLARLRVIMFSNSSPEMLPVILETCPNLKHLTLELIHDSLVTEGTSGLLTVLPRSLISSLESVEMESPITDKATELKLVRYFLENSTTLKKLVLRLHQSCRDKHKPGLLKQLLESPRCSSLCQLVII